MARQESTKQNEQTVMESARIYEEHAVPILFTPWGRRLLEAVPIKAGQDVLDVACGSGAIARLVAEQVGPDGSVTGIDMNPGMIETAKRVCADVRPPIDWHLGDATDMPFEENRYDGAVCQQGVQFIPDKHKAIREMYRVLKPGGWLGFTVWRGLEHLPGFRILCDMLEQHLGRDAGDVMRTPFGGGSMDELRSATEEAGFNSVQVTIQVGSLRYASAQEFTQLSIDGVPPGPKGHLKAMYEGVDGATRRALMEDMEQGLAARRDDEGVIWPMEAYLVRARK